MASKVKAIIAMCVTPLFLLFGAYCAIAVTASIWEQSSQEDFDSGKPEGVSISSKDQVTLSKALIPVEGDMSELRIWCLARDSKGNIYAGTGDKGKIFSISPEGEISLLFDSPETDIFSMVIDDEDNIYAGTSPDGIIYKIKPHNVPETFFNTGEKYVWSLAFDNMGDLYAGTGISGKLYKISPDGKGEAIYDSDDTHIKCLLSDGDNIYAGTEGSGIIYRVSSDGKVFVLYDTAEREVSCMAKDSDGNLYAGVAAGEPGPGGEDQGRPGMEREQTERRSYIYQITPHEVVKRVWRCPDPLIFSIAVDGDRLIVGTGDEGNIYYVIPEDEWALLAETEESQVLALHKVQDSGEIWLATGNTGKFYKLSSSYVKEGTLEAKQHDASITSKWGRISWIADQATGTTVSFSTRSGNTEKPDNTWSDWSNEYNEPNGEDINSPSARFIQWRAKLTSEDGTDTPVLRNVSITYLQRNLKPSVRSVVITSEQDRGEGPPRRPAGSGSGNSESDESENIPVSGNKVISWQARDPNGDSLEYSVYFRGVDEQNWKLMEDELKSASYPLDSESFPDGEYLIKVIATDAPSNPSNLALSDDKISKPFHVDNTPPKVTEIQAELVDNGRFVVTGKVEDVGTYVKEIVYSIDGKDWKMVFSSDQILDSKAEMFSFPTKELSAGEHTIAVKATDAAGNVGSGKIVTQVE
jgi:hypothetical protein